MYRFRPRYQARPWGGRKISETLGRVDAPAGPVGESWELADLPAHRSLTNEGESLGDLWRQGALGGSGTGPFPFLLKWLDAASPLSIQVHPDTSVAALLPGAASKSEAWYVADAAPDAQIWLGTRDEISPEAVLDAFGTPAIVPMLNSVPISQGMLLRAPAGVIHAIGAGALLLEIQEPSDTTYRIYAWDRPAVDLHVPEARRAWRGEIRPEECLADDQLTGPGFAMGRVQPDLAYAPGPLRVLVGLPDGADFRLGETNFHLPFGEVVVLAASDPAVRLTSGSALWASDAPGL